MRARVVVLPRPDILDPQGRAVGHALASLGFGGVQGVRVGRVIDVDLDDRLDRALAAAQVDAMARELLANPVIEDFAVEWPAG
ncbi:MAG: phosphoribosylformylglycinamidine synthase subunit PurS [Myxococcales bacterium]|nr:phosphoribosylformylglycinamidine synthase subunit PurS [Myxococcales bacterium]